VGGSLFCQSSLQAGMTPPGANNNTLIVFREMGTKKGTWRCRQGSSWAGGIEYVREEKTKKGEGV